VHTLSFGEGPTCFGLGTRYDCIQIVSDHSTNPGFDSLVSQLDARNHRYVKTFYDHREVCKPADRRDPRYTLLYDFIVDMMKHNGPSGLGSNITKGKRETADIL